MDERDWWPVETAATPTRTKPRRQLPVYAGRDPEDDHTDGCPGAWKTCGFVESLAKYTRSVDDQGGYSANPRLDRCQDRLVLDAIAALETWEKLARCHWAEKRSEFEERARKKK